MPGRPFEKGDARINRRGRPKGVNELRKLCQSLAHEAALKPDGSPILFNGRPLSTIELIMRHWSRSSNARLQMAFVAYGFGPPPAELVVPADMNKMTDDELDRIASGKK